MWLMPVWMSRARWTFSVRLFISSNNSVGRSAGRMFAQPGFRYWVGLMRRVLWFERKVSMLISVPVVKASARRLGFRCCWISVSVLQIQTPLPPELMGSFRTTGRPRVWMRCWGVVLSVVSSQLAQGICAAAMAFFMASLSWQRVAVAWEMPGSW